MSDRKLATHWGNVSQSGDTVTLDADEERAKGKGGDGIGSALTFLEWDGSPLRLRVKRTKVWRDEPWADFWFVARQAVVSDPWPMHYLRVLLEGLEVGHIPDFQAERQEIDVTIGTGDTLHDYPRLTWSASALHIWHPRFDRTISLSSHFCELGLYCEGCRVECEVVAVRPERQGDFAE